MRTITITGDPVVGCRSNVSIFVQDAVTGETLREIHDHNKLVLTGRNLIRSALNGTSTELTHIGYGTGTTAETDNDTTLDTETERKAFDSKVESASTLTMSYLMPATANNGTTFTEAGAFTALSGGTMFNRFVHTAILKSSSIQILYVIVVGISEI